MKNIRVLNNVRSEGTDLPVFELASISVICVKVFCVESVFRGSPHPAWDSQIAHTSP